MSKTERSSSEILQRINKLQAENHMRTTNTDKTRGNPNEINISQTKSDNPIQKWLIENFMNKSWY